MRVKLLVGRPEAGRFLQPGDEHDYPQDEALRLISGGYAAPVAAAKVERAVKPPAPERRKAAKREPRG